jgi:hypothetical protein
MNTGLLIFIIILGTYIGGLIYLNSKVRSGDPPLPHKYGPLRTAVSYSGAAILGLFLLVLLIFTVGVLFFRDEFFLR